MKRIVKPVAVIVVGILGFSGIALAQQECKVALVNFQEVIARSDAGKAASDKFDARIRELGTRIDQLRKEITDARLALDGQNGIPNQTYRAQLNNSIVEKNQEIAQVQKDADAYRESLINALTNSASGIAKRVAAERGINSVVDSSSPTTSVPANGDATNCDITSEVKARMDANFNVADSTK